MTQLTLKPLPRRVLTVLQFGERHIKFADKVLQAEADFDTLWPIRSCHWIS